MNAPANDALTTWRALKADKRLSSADRVVGAHIARVGGVRHGVQEFAAACRLPADRVAKSLRTLTERGHIAPSAAAQRGTAIDDTNTAA